MLSHVATGHWALPAGRTVDSWAAMQKRLWTVPCTSGSRRERALECELGDPISRPVALDKSLQLSECFSSYVKGRARNQNSQKHAPQRLLKI